MLNSILRDHDFARGEVSNATVVAAVKEAETIIADGIVDAYSVPYPQLHDFLEALVPGMPITLTTAQLHAHFNKNNPLSYDWNDALQMLIEVGVVGRVVESKGVYLKADFEYLNPSRMYVTDSEQLCLHPVFIERYSAKLPTSPDSYTPVYPLGSDLDDAVGRELILPAT